MSVHYYCSTMSVIFTFTSFTLSLIFFLASIQILSGNDTINNDNDLQRTEKTTIGQQRFLRGMTTNTRRTKRGEDIGNGRFRAIPMENKPSTHFAAGRWAGDKNTRTTQLSPKNSQKAAQDSYTREWSGKSDSSFSGFSSNSDRSEDGWSEDSDSSFDQHLPFGQKSRNGRQFERNPNGKSFQMGGQKMASPLGKSPETASGKVHGEKPAESTGAGSILGKLSNWTGFGRKVGKTENNAQFSQSIALKSESKGSLKSEPQNMPASFGKINKPALPKKKSAMELYMEKVEAQKKQAAETWQKMEEEKQAEIQRKRDARKKEIEEARRKEEDETNKKRMKEAEEAVKKREVEEAQRQKAAKERHEKLANVVNRQSMAKGRHLKTHPPPHVDDKVQSPPVEGEILKKSEGSPGLKEVKIVAKSEDRDVQGKEENLHLFNNHLGQRLPDVEFHRQSDKKPNKKQMQIRLVKGHENLLPNLVKSASTNSRRTKQNVPTKNVKKPTRSVEEDKESMETFFDNVLEKKNANEKKPDILPLDKTSSLDRPTKPIRSEKTPQARNLEMLKQFKRDQPKMEDSYQKYRKYREKVNEHLKGLQKSPQQKVDTESPAEKEQRKMESSQKVLPEKVGIKEHKSELKEESIDNVWHRIKHGNQNQNHEMSHPSRQHHRRLQEEMLDIDESKKPEKIQIPSTKAMEVEKKIPTNEDISSKSHGQHEESSDNMKNELKEESIDSSKNESGSNHQIDKESQHSLVDKAQKVQNEVPKNEAKDLEEEERKAIEQEYAEFEAVSPLQVEKSNEAVEAKLRTSPKNGAENKSAVAEDQMESEELEAMREASKKPSSAVMNDETNKNMEKLAVIERLKTNVDGEMEHENGDLEEKPEANLKEKSLIKLKQHSPQRRAIPHHQHVVTPADRARAQELFEKIGQFQAFLLQNPDKKQMPPNEYREFMRKNPEKEQMHFYLEMLPREYKPLADGWTVEVGTKLTFLVADSIKRGQQGMDKFIDQLNTLLLWPEEVDRLKQKAKESFAMASKYPSAGGEWGKARPLENLGHAFTTLHNFRVKLNAFFYRMVEIARQFPEDFFIFKTEKKIFEPKAHYEKLMQRKATKLRELDDEYRRKRRGYVNWLNESFPELTYCNRLAKEKGPQGWRIGDSNDMLKDWKKVDDKEAALARCQHNSEPDKWMLPTAQDWHAYFGPKQKVPDVVEKLSDKWRLLMLTAYEKLQKHHFVDACVHGRHWFNEMAFDHDRIKQLEPVLKKLKWSWSRLSFLNPKKRKQINLNIKSLGLLIGFGKALNHVMAKMGVVAQKLDDKIPKLADQYLSMRLYNGLNNVIVLLYAALKPLATASQRQLLEIVEAKNSGETEQNGQHKGHDVKVDVDKEQEHKEVAVVEHNSKINEVAVLEKERSEEEEEESSSDEDDFVQEEENTPKITSEWDIESQKGRAKKLHESLLLTRHLARLLQPYLERLGLDEEKLVKMFDENQGEKATMEEQIRGLNLDGTFKEFMRPRDPNAIFPTGTLRKETERRIKRNAGLVLSVYAKLKKTIWQKSPSQNSAEKQREEVKKLMKQMLDRINKQHGLITDRLECHPAEEIPIDRGQLLYQLQGPVL